MRPILKALLLASLVSGASLASAADPLVDVSWVKANLGKPNIVLLDVRSGGGATKDAFHKEHIPGSVFTDYGKGGWREKNAEGVEGMLPAREKLEKTIGDLGIDNSTHVVVVPMGQQAADVAAATRIYWTFKVMGHDDVSILDGGWVAWTREVDPQTQKPVNPISAGSVEPQAKTFAANLRSDMLIGRDDVKRALDNGMTLVDNRPYDFHVGMTVSPVVKRAGTIPGAKSVQDSWLTRNNGGFFRPKEQLATLYKKTGVPVDGDHITFCNTGHWASLGWFVSSEILGNKKVRLYDGSMAEWSQHENLPVEQKLKVD
jgi:thiosulfate/3-mercaptopyruvate sulfurtransferase